MQETLTGNTHTHWIMHTHATAHRPNVPRQTSNMAGTWIPTWDHRADASSSVPWIPAFCPISPLSHCQPRAPLSLEPSTCPANTRTQVFSPSFDAALPLFLTNQALPPWPPHPLTPLQPSLTQDHLQGPNNLQCPVPLKEEA